MLPTFRTVVKQEYQEVDGYFQQGAQDFSYQSAGMADYDRYRKSTWDYQHLRQGPAAHSQHPDAAETAAMNSGGSSAYVPSNSYSMSSGHHYTPNASSYSGHVGYDNPRASYSGAYGQAASGSEQAGPSRAPHLYQPQPRVASGTPYPPQYYQAQSALQYPANDPSYAGYYYQNSQSIRGVAM
jgi:hypothetical protein